MVLRRGHQRHAFAVTERKHGDFRAGHAFFDQHDVAGGPKLALRHDGVQRTLGLLHAVGQEDALARGEAAGLDDGRLIQSGEIVQRRFQIREGHSAAGRDVVALHERFGEGL